MLLNLSSRRKSVADVGKQGEMPGAFNSNGKLALMLRTGTSDAAGDNFCPFRQASSQFWDIFVIADMLNFIGTKGTNLFTAFSAAVSASFRPIESHE